MSIDSEHGMGLHVVIFGNPIDGMSIIGPFNHAPEAVDWADENADGTWWVAPLHHQEEFEEEDDD